MLSFIHDWLHNRQTTFGSTRSPKWSEVRNKFIKENPTCAVCGKKGTALKPLNAHHLAPFHLHPEDELNPRNLISLCRPDHLLFGHLNNFKAFNPNVEEDSKIWKDKITSRPY